MSDVEDLTETSTGPDWWGGSRGADKDEPCECGGHFEAWFFKTQFFHCHRGTDGRLLCTTHRHSGIMRRGDQRDPVAEAHERVRVAAHGEAS